MSYILFKENPNEGEGFLTDERAKYISNDHFCEIAQKYHLDEYLF